MNKLPLTHFVIAASMLMLGAAGAHASPPAAAQQGQSIDVFGIQFCMGETPRDLPCDVRLDATTAAAKPNPGAPMTLGNIIWTSAAPVVTSAGATCSAVLPGPLSFLCNLELLGDASATGTKRAVDGAKRGDS